LFINLVDINELELYDEVEVNRELIDKEAKKAKFKLLRPLSKAHKIVVYICSSSSRTDYFR